MFKTFMMITAIVIGFPLSAAAEPTAEESIRSKNLDLVEGFIVGIGRAFEWAKRLAWWYSPLRG